MPAQPTKADPVKAFKAELADPDLLAVVQKHLSTGRPVALSDDDYFQLRRLVAAQFQLHPSAVIVVGSTRTGFSLNPRHAFRPIASGSDIDVAIVSADRFDDYWDRVFEYTRSDYAWDDARRFKKNLFQGWIDPRFLPNNTRFGPALEWTRFFDGLMQSRRYGLRKITARLYRTWQRLDAAQEKAVLECRARDGISR